MILIRLLFLDYSDTKVIRILNSELADTLGNLLNRCCGTTLNPHQVYPAINTSTFESILTMDVTKKLIDSLNELPRMQLISKSNKTINKYLTFSLVSFFLLFYH